MDGVADEFVLQLAEEAEVKAREADRSKLRLATHWAERHRVDDVFKAAHWSDADVRDLCEAIGGEGTPLVHEAAVTPLAAALTVSARAAMQLMSDGLDLKHRLPKTFEAVEELRLAPWRGRQIAQLTHRLSVEAAAYVDAEVAPVADTAGRVRIERLVSDAAARFDVDEQAAAEDVAKEAWTVRLENYSGPVWAGTSRLEVIGDTPTLKKFYDLVNKTAHKRLDPAQPAEDQPSLDHRRVAALGDIAEGAGASSKTKLYVHLSPDDELGFVERFGPLTAASIRQLATGQPVHTAARARHASHRRGRRLRATRVDARARHPPRPHLRPPQLHQGLARLRPRPHRGLRRDGRRRTAGSDPARQPRTTMQATPSGKDPLRLVLPAQRGRQLHLARPVRAHLRRRYFTLTTSITNHSVELPGMLSPLPSAP